MTIRLYDKIRKERHRGVIPDYITDLKLYQIWCISWYIFHSHLIIVLFFLYKNQLSIVTHISPIGDKKKKFSDLFGKVIIFIKKNWDIFIIFRIICQLDNKYLWNERKKLFAIGKLWIDTQSNRILIRICIVKSDDFHKSFVQLTSRSNRILS